MSYEVGGEQSNIEKKCFPRIAKSGEMEARIQLGLIKSICLHDDFSMGLG